MNSRMTSNPSTQAPGAVPFDRLADQYDHWFDTGRGSRLFQPSTHHANGEHT